MSASPQPKPDGGEVGIYLCEANADCLAGHICVNRYCKYPGNLPDGQIVSLHVLPPSTHRYTDDNTFVLKQQFLGQDARSINGGSIVLRPAYLVTGTLKVQDQEESLSARIRFYDRESIAGAPIEISAECAKDGQFKARLTHGLYDVEITPTDDKHPPHRISKVKIEKDGALVLTIPKDESYPRLTGRIVTPDTGVAISGLRVQVFSASDKSVSSIAVTDKDGAFRLWLSAKEKPHRIRIHMRGYNKGEASAHPQIDIPFAPVTIAPGEKIELGDLKVGFLVKEGEMPTLSGSVHATEQHAAREPLKGSEVHMIGTIDLKTNYKGQPIVGYYRVSTISKEGGAFSAKIIPGSYQIDVLPPIESRELWARASVQQDNIFSNKSDFQIHLQPKPKITGKICQKGEKGQCAKEITQAQIQAVWRGPLNKSLSVDKRPSVPTPETPSKLSDGTGWYTLPLDPGIYDLIFVPPVDSGLARRIRFNIRVEASDMPQDVDAFLSSANHFSGVILGPDRFPIPNTIVEMYSHPNNPDQPVRLLGRATANSAGKFSLAYHLPNNND